MLIIKQVVLIGLGLSLNVSHKSKLRMLILVFILVIYDAHTHTKKKSCSLTSKTDEGPNPCEMVKQPRYRKGPDVCFDEAKQVKLNL